MIAVHYDVNGDRHDGLQVTIYSRLCHFVDYAN